MDKLQAMTTFVRIVERGSLTRAAEALGDVAAVRGAHAGGARTRRRRAAAQPHHAPDPPDRRGRAVSRPMPRDPGGRARRRRPRWQRGRRNRRGDWRVTAPVLFGRRYVAPVVTAFLARYAAVNAELLLLDRPVDIVEEGLDAGVRIGALADSSLVAHSGRRPCAASSARARATCASTACPKTPEDLRSHACVRFARTHARHRMALPRRPADRRVAVPTRFATNQVDAADRRVRGGPRAGHVPVLPGRGRRGGTQAALRAAGVRARSGAGQRDLSAGAAALEHRARRFVDLAVATLRATRFDVTLAHRALHFRALPTTKGYAPWMPTSNTPC